ncbi:MAG TPA: hypothetical protein VKV25_07250 [Acidimicrobiales bacterium]|nr:hypothetical protein [Acidimicrobiales bacterium]
MTADRDEARRLLAAGVHVALVLPAGETAPEAGAGPGRLAVLVGDPADPAVAAAADEMAGELFGPAS